MLVVTLNICLGAAINFYDVLHRFWEGRGMGTTYLEVKLIQNLMAIREEVLYTIFLDLHKMYKALER